MQIIARDQIKQYTPWLILAMVPVVLFGYLYPHYLRDSTFFWVCMITLPLSAQNSPSPNRLQTFWMAFLFNAVCIILPSTIGIYMVLCFILMTLLQNLVGSIHLTLIIHAFLASPFFSYFNTLASVPIRLFLSRVVAFILQTIGLDVQIDGNMVYLENSQFLVDEACAGLSMLGYGLLFGTVILAQLSKGKVVKPKLLISLYVVLIGLIFSANIIRIALLILFQIMPEHWLHEAIGFIIYGLQILVPFYLLGKYILSKKYTHSPSQIIKKPVFPKVEYLVLLVLFITIIARHQVQSGSTQENQSIQLDGFTTEKVKGQIIKLKNENTLIYIKPPIPPYRADHSPMVCWQGSGYHFKRINRWTIKNIDINHAELTKGNDTVYTGWWFQSKKRSTGDQFEWRKYGLLENEKFYLVNVTCATEEELKREIGRLLNKNLLM